MGDELRDAGYRREHPDLVHNTGGNRRGCYRNIRGETY